MTRECSPVAGPPPLDRCRRCGSCSAGRLGQGVVLPGELDSGAEFEVALLAAEAPDDRAGLVVDLVDRPGVAGGDQQVAVAVGLTELMWK